MKTIHILAILTLVAIFGCGQTTTSGPEPTNDEIPENAVIGDEDAPLPDVIDSIDGLYGFQEIANHGSTEDCWIAMDGKVYDVTEFVDGHPGGAALLEGCGTDGSKLYATRPMGSGTPHSSRARSLLEDYYIGEQDE